MKHSLFILISFLLLSSPVIGENHKGETLYRWSIYPELVWKGFGDKETHPEYKGEVENGIPNGLGFIIHPNGNKFVGSWVNGKKLDGTFTYIVGSKYVGSWLEGEWWKGILYDEYGKVHTEYVNGKEVKQ